MATYSGPVYTVPFAATALTTAGAYDVFGLLASANNQIEVHSIDLGVSSTGAAPLAYSVQLLRGSTASSTSAAVTPVFRLGYSTPTPPAAASSATAPSSGLVSTASAVLLYADAAEVSDGNFCYHPDEDERQIINMSQRLHVRVAPSVALTLTGTLTFREIGKPAVS